MGGVVITGGRVVDPASGLDGLCDVALQDGRIAAIGAGLGSAERVIDATGLVVAPGFIDLHAHGQSIPADRMQAFDGVTTTLDLEAGVMPVGSWYRRQAAQGRVLNYGASTNWAFARIGAMTGFNEESSLESFGRAMRDRRWIENIATGAEIGGILDSLARGLREGGIGIGILNAYAPGAGVQELTAVCQLAAAHAVPTFTHIAYMSRIDPESAAEAYIRLIGYAGATGAHMHICHFNSSSKTDVERCAKLVEKALEQGLPITLEAYPYGTGSTVLAAAFFSDPEFVARNGTGYDSVQRVTDGRRFRDRAELLAAQAEEPSTMVLWHILDTESNARHRDLLDMSVLFPGGRDRVGRDALVAAGRVHLYRRCLAAAGRRHVPSALRRLLHALHQPLGAGTPGAVAAGGGAQMRADPGRDPAGEHAGHGPQGAAGGGRRCGCGGVRFRHAGGPVRIRRDEPPGRGRAPPAGQRPPGDHRRGAGHSRPARPAGAPPGRR